MSTKLKRIVISIFIILLVISCLACGKSKSDSKEKLKIGISIYDEYDPFTNTIGSQIQKKLYEIAKENNITINVNLTYSNRSQMKQNDQVSEYIKKDYDLICVNLADRTDAMQIIDMAKNADIPVIFFNRELVKEDLARWNKLYYVGARPEESGQLQGQIVLMP